ncbi:TIMELESS-interacting protein [Frankliniella fusca]|uniref:TIMELESS-interacting protein n=1 Tax=Frankliniella fusca TaxID=407009 RepID=A0AAE1LD57_9NEOP|nr:TIMELESS-interacting protein [Frankliniella fusca]
MAYTVDDLFGSDSLLGDPNDLDNLVEFGDARNHSDNEGSGEEAGGEGEDADKESSKKDKPDEKKVVRIRRPQPKLDAERLKGPRGLKQLKNSFTDIKFKGKNHETEDLQKVMARLEHWSHRLFPKFQFDDFLEKVEKLGSKKQVQNYVKRLRMGLEDDDDGVVRSENEEAVDDPDPIADDTLGEFDRLLAEQVTLHENSLSVSTPRTPGAAANNLRTPSIPPVKPPAISSTPAQPTLSEEQRARIERNRLAAMERRRARAAALAAEQQGQQQQQDLQGQQGQQDPQAEDADSKQEGGEARARPESTTGVTEGEANNVEAAVEAPAGAPVPSPNPRPQPAPGPGPPPPPAPEPAPQPGPEPNPSPERAPEPAPEAAPEAAARRGAGEVELPSSVETDSLSLLSPPAEGAGPAEFCLSETSSSSGDVQVVIGTTAVQSDQCQGGAEKKGLKRQLSRSDSSSDDDFSPGKSSSSNSCESSSASSPAIKLSDKGDLAKDPRMVSPIPSEDYSSWGLAAFMEQDEVGPPQIGHAEKKPEAPPLDNQKEGNDYSEEDMEVLNIIHNPAKQ